MTRKQLFFFTVFYAASAIVMLCLRDATGAKYIGAGMLLFSAICFLRAALEAE